MRSEAIQFSEIAAVDRFTVEQFVSPARDLIEEIKSGKYELVPIADIGKVRGGKRLPVGSTYAPEGIPYVRSTDIKGLSVDLSNVVYITKEQQAIIARYPLEYMDVVVTIAGTIGNIGVMRDKLPACQFNENMARITRIRQDINPEYLAVYLDSRFGQAFVEHHTGGAVQPKLSLERINRILVPLPPRPVQDQIAAIMQEAYAKRREMLTEAEELLGGVEGHVLKTLAISDELPADNPRFVLKKSRLHRFDVRYFSPFYDSLENLITTGSYPTEILGRLCRRLINGLTPGRADYTVEGCAVVKVGSLTRDWRVDWEQVAFTSEAFFEKAKKAHVEDGDLLILAASHQLDYIGRTFAVVRGIPAEFSGRCMTVGELIIARAKRELVLPGYLLACFMTKPIQELVNRMTRGQSAHLYAKDLKDLRIPVPPLGVQQAIVNEINRRRSEAKRLFTEAETLVFEAKKRVERMILGEAEDNR
jgi:type I restriction enzyme S subunit